MISKIYDIRIAHAAGKPPSAPKVETYEYQFDLDVKSSSVYSSGDLHQM